jgi:polyhydroxyalkanoate synthesis repressor PhaR
MRYVPLVSSRDTGPRLVKRYENRKLYDSQARRYVTIEKLAEMVAGGQDLHVVDQKSGDDITSVVLAQVVLEGLKQRTARIPRQVLSRLVRLGFAPRRGSSHEPSPARLAEQARAEAERIATGLLSRGRLSIEEALALRRDITQAVQRIVTETQNGLEARIRGLIELSESEAGLTPSLETLRQRLLTFESQLEPRVEPSGSAGSTPARRRRAAAKPRGRKRRKRAPEGRDRAR